MFDNVDDDHSQVIVSLDHGLSCCGVANLLLKWKLQTELTQKRRYIQDLTHCNNKTKKIFLSHFPIIDDGDESYLLNILKVCDEAFEILPACLKLNREFVLKCLRVNGKLFDRVMRGDDDCSILKDAMEIENVVKGLTKFSITCLPYQPLQYLIGNRDFFMKWVSVNPTIFKFACRTLKNDDELMFQALKYNRQHLTFATLRQLNNRELVFRACETKESFSLFPIRYSKKSVLEMCLPVAKNNPNLALEILQRDSESAACAIRNFKNHKEIILRAIGIAPHMIFKVMKQYRWFSNNMKEICLNALKIDKRIFNDLGKFKFDREIFLAGFDGCSTKNFPVPSEMLQDKEIAICLVRNDPSYMNQIAEHLRKDRDIILQLAFHIHYLSNEFREMYIPNFSNDREFLLKATKSTGTSSVLALASEELKNDRDFILDELLKSSHTAMPHIPLHYRLDPEIIKIYVRETVPFHFNASLVPKSVLEDTDLVWELIKVQENFIRHFPDHEFFKHKDTILKMISYRVRCYEIISNEFRNDPEIKMALIKLGNYNGSR